ncbi:uncharacterized protein ACIQIH_000490 isoform 2-T5 [Cyanocitta cristata]
MLRSRRDDVAQTRQRCSEGRGNRSVGSDDASSRRRESRSLHRAMGVEPGSGLEDREAGLFRDHPRKTGLRGMMVASPETACDVGGEGNKSLQWTKEATQAFDQLKKALLSAPALRLPDWEPGRTLETIEATYSSHPDLKDTPLEGAETYFADRSSYVISGKRHAGYAVTTSQEDYWV